MDSEASTSSETTGPAKRKNEGELYAERMNDEQKKQKTSEKKNGADKQQPVSIEDTSNESQIPLPPTPNSENVLPTIDTTSLHTQIPDSSPKNTENFPLSADDSGKLKAKKKSRFKIKKRVWAKLSTIKKMPLNAFQKSKVKTLPIRNSISIGRCKRNLIDHLHPKGYLCYL